jgi:cell division protein FtsQ
MRKLIDLIKNNKRWNIILWCAIVCFLVLAFMSIQSKEEQLVVKEIEVKIEPKEELAFIDSLTVLSIIKGADSSQNIMGSEERSLKLDIMEVALEAYPFIEKADISLDLSGRMMIKIIQRQPLLRIISNRGQSYYVAKNGYKMPLHEGFAPRVIIANGNIAETLADSGFLRTQITRDLLKIADWCYNDEFWQAQIEQLYVDNYMDIILIPKVGNHTIVFGSAERIENKFETLKTFYLKGLNAVGWEQYKKINLKYEGQIVAERKENAINTQTTQP